MIFIATERGTPRRSRFRTAVLRKSCAIRPGTPASLQAVFQTFRSRLRRSPTWPWPRVHPACLHRAVRWGWQRLTYTFTGFVTDALGLRALALVHAPEALPAIEKALKRAREK